MATGLSYAPQTQLQRGGAQLDISSLVDTNQRIESIGGYAGGEPQYDQWYQTSDGRSVYQRPDGSFWETYDGGSGSMMRTFDQEGNQLEDFATGRGSFWDNTLGRYGLGDIGTTVANDPKLLAFLATAAGGAYASSMAGGGAAATSGTGTAVGGSGAVSTPVSMGSVAAPTAVGSTAAGGGSGLTLSGAGKAAIAAGMLAGAAGGSGGGSDMSGLDNQLATNSEIARRQMAMQEELFAYFQGRQPQLDALTDRLTNSQISLADEALAQGRDLYAYNKEVFRPVEQSLVAEAMRESTPEYYEKYASEAMAAHAAAQANAQGQTERVLTSMGVNPNSGAWQSQQRGLQLDNAAGMGKVANESRDRAEAMGWAKRAEAAGLGKGLVGAGQAAYGIASGATTAAGATAYDGSKTAASTLTAPGDYGKTGASVASSSANTLADIYRTQSNNNDRGGLWNAAGTALGMWAAGGFV